MYFVEFICTAWYYISKEDDLVTIFTLYEIYCIIIVDN